MQEIEKNNPKRKLLISLVNAMSEEIQMREEDKILIILQMNTEEKIEKFFDWIESKMENEKLKTTTTEVMNITARIGRLRA